MAKTTNEAGWGFDPVFDLIRSLSTATIDPSTETPPSISKSLKDKPPDLDTTFRAQKDDKHDGTLGDFSRIFDFLGSSPLSPVVQAPAPPVVVESIVDREEYTSDGAIYRPPSPKGVKWRDEATFGAAELTDTAPEELSEVPNGHSPMTKKQRKRQRQRDIKLKAKATSEIESEGELLSPRKKPPAAKASVHNAASDSIAGMTAAQGSIRDQKKDNISVGVAKTSIEAAKAAVAATLNMPPPNLPLHNGIDKNEPLSTSPKKQADFKPTTAPTTPKTKANAAKPLQMKSEPRFVPGKRYFESNAYTFTPTDDVVPTQPIHSYQQYTLLSAAPYQSHFPTYSYLPQFQPALLPSMIPPPQQVSYHAPQASLPNINFTANMSQPTSLTLRSRDDRYWSLRLKLLNDFPDDRSWLVKLVQHSGHTSTPSGVHVFVDFSNIYIGFLHRLNEITRAKTSSPQFNKALDFESLVLLLERGRPVAKRVIAGSAPLLPAFDLAKSIGYELNILEKVYKSRELTQRQKFFKRMEAQQQQPHRGVGKTPGSANYSGQSSEGEAEELDTDTAEFTPEKWVEQAVDEILHLKMLESIVDAEEPSTIVLATGDAAEAEYSAGFMKMVERALVKGWKVELVAFSKSISKAYRARDFTRKWKGQFECVELDVYLDELVDT